MTPRATDRQLLLDTPERCSLLRGRPF
jgi:hypothetical protein